jgi:hypothetical protein
VTRCWNRFRSVSTRSPRSTSRSIATPNPSGSELSIHRSSIVMATGAPGGRTESALISAAGGAQHTLSYDPALAYDAALVVITATEYLREGPTAIPITPGNVWREITDIHSATPSQPGADKAIDGATGTIDYGGDIGRHVPVGKQIAILRIQEGQVDSQIQAFCGTAIGQIQDSWCPSD